MQPILLATGEQRPLAPLTEDLAPAMLPVGHQPVMAHVIEMLAAQGWRRQLVSLHHQAASIEAYFGQGQRWGVNLEYVVQRDALGTAGALKWAGRMLSETILVIPADRLFDLDLTAAVEYHRRHGPGSSAWLRGTHQISKRLARAIFHRIDRARGGSQQPGHLHPGTGRYGSDTTLRAV